MITKINIFNNPDDTATISLNLKKITFITGDTHTQLYTPICTMAHTVSNLFLSDNISIKDKDTVSKKCDRVLELWYDSVEDSEHYLQIFARRTSSNWYCYNKQDVDGSNIAAPKHELSINTLSHVPEIFYISDDKVRQSINAVFDRLPDRGFTSNIFVGMVVQIFQYLHMDCEMDTAVYLHLPEAGLSESEQRRLLREIIYSLNATTQVIISSHSSVMFNELRLAIQDELISAEDVVAYHNKGLDTDGIFDLEEITFNTIGKASRHPVGFFDEHRNQLAELANL